MKCRLLDVTWPSHSSTHSSCVPAQDQDSQNLHKDGVIFRPHPFTEESVAVDSCWER